MAQDDESELRLPEEPIDRVLGPLERFLHIEAAGGSHLHDFFSLEIHFRKAFAALDARHAQIRDQIEIRGKVSLGHGHFKWAAARNRGHMIFFGRCDFFARGRFLGNLPAGHGNFKNGH